MAVRRPGYFETVRSEEAKVTKFGSIVVNFQGAKYRIQLPDEDRLMRWMIKSNRNMAEAHRKAMVILAKKGKGLVQELCGNQIPKEALSGVEFEVVLELLSALADSISKLEVLKNRGGK